MVHLNLLYHGLLLKDIGNWSKIIHVSMMPFPEKNSWIFRIRMENNQVDVQIGGKDVKINQSTFYALRILYRLDEAKGRTA